MIAFILARYPTVVENVRLLKICVSLTKEIFQKFRRKCVYEEFNKAGKHIFTNGNIAKFNSKNKL